MTEYTECMEINAELIDIYADDDEENNIYAKTLYENAKRFRTFDKALSAFILEHGYQGESADIKAMSKFMRSKFEENSIDKQVRFRELFTSSKRRDRETAYKICFALNLSVEETNDFFRRVMLERGIDCHAVNEVVYYFCIRNGLTYIQAREIIEGLSDIKKRKEMPEDNILYTETIINYVDSIAKKEELICYIENNRESFEYKNAAAIRYIKNFWGTIKGPEGVALKEGILVDKMVNPFHPDRSKNGDGDTREKDIIERDIKREKELMEDDYVVSKEKSSKWIIYCQIIGLDNIQEKCHAYNRTIDPIIKENVLLPLTADICFPSRQIIDGITRGKSDGDYEMYRKTLILLAFYTYWAKKVITKNDVYYRAKHYDRDKCRDYIDMYLKDAGYPELYAGNPYDWIFLWSMNDEHPLEAFRAYMREVYIAKSNAEE